MTFPVYILTAYCMFIYNLLFLFSFVHFTVPSYTLKRTIWSTTTQSKEVFMCKKKGAFLSVIVFIQQQQQVTVRKHSLLLLSYVTFKNVIMEKQSGGLSWMQFVNNK